MTSQWNVADEQAINKLVLGYARGADRRDASLFGSQFVTDGVLETRQVMVRGQAEISRVPERLKAYAKTYHTLLNIFIEIDGDEGTGEIYSLAHHLMPRAEGKYDDLVMHITYHDRYVRSGDVWLIKHRRVVTEFTESRIVDLIDP